MDIRVVCRQEQEGEAVLMPPSLPRATSLSGRHPFKYPGENFLLQRMHHRSGSFSTPCQVPAELNLKPAFPVRKEEPELEGALAGQAPQKAL